MNSKLPVYIPESIAVNTVRYEWDEWDPYSFLGDVDESVLKQCGALSDRAAMIFSIGCLEWVLARLDLMITNKLPYQYLAACKALVLGAPMALPPFPDSSQWQGNVMSPIGLAIVNTLNTWYMAEEGEADVNAAFSAKVPMHLLGDQAERYVVWQYKVLARLATLYPYNDDDCMETLVPLAMLHTDWDPDGKDLPSIAVKELSEIDLQNNPLIDLTL